MSNLLLTRKAGQAVQIGDAGCVVEVVNVRHSEVTIKVGARCERLRIGNKFNVAERAILTVVGITKGCARLAFEAERSVTIVRMELLPCQ